MVIKAREKTNTLKKYERENRSADGVVKFASIDLSRAHTADKGLYTVVGIVGFFIGVFGLLLLVAGFKALAPPLTCVCPEMRYFGVSHLASLL